MPVMDEFREEREAIKNADLKTKWNYFLDYYKWHVIGGAAALFFVISLAYAMITAKDVALNGYFLNTYVDEIKSEAFTNEFAAYQNINTNKYNVSIDTSLYILAGSMDETTITSAEKLMVTVAAREVDFVAGDEETFLQYASTDTFFDLREIYSEEDLEKFSDYIYYIDMETVREKDLIIENGQVDNYNLPAYDHFNPEEMVDPVPIALCIQDCPKLQDSYFFQKGLIPMAIVVNTNRLDTTLDFIDYLFEDMIP